MARRDNNILLPAHPERSEHHSQGSLKVAQNVARAAAGFASKRQKTWSVNRLHQHDGNPGQTAVMAEPKTAPATPKISTTGKSHASDMPTPGVFAGTRRSPPRRLRCSSNSRVMREQDSCPLPRCPTAHRMIDKGFRLLARNQHGGPASHKDITALRRQHTEGENSRSTAVIGANEDHQYSAGSFPSISRTCFRAHAGQSHTWPCRAFSILHASASAGVASARERPQRTHIGGS